MIKMRQIATAFLFQQDSVLMMKRQGAAPLPEEYWTAIGGHLEEFELNDPYAACLREIHEETGITAEEIEGLTLRYILLRRKDNEIRQQFVYFGHTHRTDPVESDEGELHWVKAEDLLQLNLSKIIALMLEHDNNHRDHDSIFIGTMTVSGDDVTPIVLWSPLHDPQVF
jgi:8-oxo-dGTP diphosphatase